MKNPQLIFLLMVLLSLLATYVLYLIIDKRRENEADDEEFDIW